MSHITDNIRKYILGQDLYQTCKERGGAVSSDELSWRLKMLQDEGLFKDCSKEDLVRICDFKKEPTSSCAASLSGRDKSDWESLNVCGICMVDEDSKEELPIRTPCGHMFHASCLMSWAKGFLEFKCPLCRRTIYVNTSNGNVIFSENALRVAQPRMDQEQIDRQLVQSHALYNRFKRRYNQLMRNRVGMSRMSSYINRIDVGRLENNRFYLEECKRYVDQHHREFRMGDLLTLLAFVKKNDVDLSSPNMAALDFASYCFDAIIPSGRASGELFQGIDLNMITPIMETIVWCYELVSTAKEFRFTDDNHVFMLWHYDEDINTEIRQALRNMMTYYANKKSPYIVDLVTNINLEIRESFLRAAATMVNLMFPDENLVYSSTLGAYIGSREWTLNKLREAAEFFENEE